MDVRKNPKFFMASSTLPLVDGYKNHEEVLAPEIWQIIKLSTESINILGILALGSILWMNLGSLEYLTPK